MTIGKLSVILGLSSGQYTAGMRKAGKQADNLDEKFRKPRMSLAKMARGFAVVGAAASAAAVAFFRVGMAQAQIIDAQAKFAGRLGMTVQALRELEHSANLSGVAVSEMQMGLQRMVRRISTAQAMGQGPLVQALDELNLKAQDLMKLTPEDQFRAIAEAMGEIPNTADKVRLAFALFDSGGVKMLQMMEQGAAGLDNAAEEFRKSVGVLTEAEAAQVEQLNDAWTRLGVTFTGFKDVAAVTLANTIIPAINTSADVMRSFNRAMRDSIALWHRFSDAVLIAPANFLQRQISNINRQLAELFTTGKISRIEIETHLKPPRNIETWAEGIERMTTRGRYQAFARAMQDLARENAMRQQMHAQRMAEAKALADFTRRERDRQRLAWELDQERQHKERMKQDRIFWAHQAIAQEEAKRRELELDRADIMDRRRGPAPRDIAQSIRSGSEEAIIARARTRIDPQLDQVKKQTRELEENGRRLDRVNANLDALRSELRAAESQPVEVAIIPGA